MFGVLRECIRIRPCLENEKHKIQCSSSTQYGIFGKVPTRYIEFMYKSNIFERPEPDYYKGPQRGAPQAPAKIHLTNILYLVLESLLHRFTVD